MCVGGGEGGVIRSSVEPDCSQMSSYNHVCDCVEHESDVSRVSGTREVSVDLFLVPRVVQGQETLPDVVLCIVKSVGACDSGGRNKNLVQCFGV